MTHHHIRKFPWLDTILSHLNPVHIHISYASTTFSNINLPSTPGSLKWASFQTLKLNFLIISILTACHAYLVSEFDKLNNIFFTLQIGKRLIMLFLSPST
jgi:hypothetical protein